MDVKISELLAAACPENLPDPAAPDTERLRELVSAGIRAGSAPKRRVRRLGRTALLAAALAALLGVGALAAVNGGFDWLRETVSPQFIDDVEPVEQSVTDEGVELTVIAAQKFGGQAVYYVSLHDTAGLGRVQSDIVWQKIIAGGSTTSELVYCDEEDGTAVYEVRADGVELADGTAPLKMEGMYYDKLELRDAAVDIELAGTPVISPEEVSALMYDFDAETICELPGTGVEIVGAVYCEGEFVLIYDEPPDGSRLNQIRPVLITPDGERLALGSGSAMWSADYRRTSCSIAVEYAALAGSTLCFYGQSYSVLNGDWEISVDFDEAEGILERTLDIDADGEVLADCVVTVSPMGVNLTAPGFEAETPHERMDIARLTVILTTADGEKDLTQICSVLYTGGKARVCWPTDVALNLDEVQSLRIGDTLIPLG